MFSDFKSNEKNEKNGVALDYGNFRVIAARAGGANKDYEKTMEELIHPYRRAIKLDAMDDDKSLEILYTGYARAVILDWMYKGEEGEWISGIEDPKTGDMVPVSEEVVIRVFKKFPDLFLDIKDAVTSIRTFRTQDDKTAVGN